MVDTSRLGAQMAQQYFTCTVLDIPSGAAPKLITVRLPTIDGPANVARWFGFPSLEVGSSVICRRDPNDQDVLIVEGSGDEAIGTGAWPAPGEIIIGIDKYDTFAAAAAALSADDVIKLGPGSYDCDGVTIDTDCKVVCSAREGATLGTTASANALIIDNATVILENVEVNGVSTSGNVNGTKVTNGGHLTLSNALSIGASSAGTAYGVLLENSGSGGALTAIDSFISGQQILGTGTGKALGIEDNASSVATLIDTELYSDNGDLTMANGTVMVYGAILNGSISQTGGTIIGWYYDKTNDIVIGSKTTDMGPGGALRGIANRLLNPESLSGWTAHFRTGDTAGSGELADYGFITGYGSFTTPTVNYSYQDDYLRLSGGSKYFLARTISGSNIGERFVCHLVSNTSMNAGIRVDDGSDNNYYEAIIEDLGDGTVRVNMRERTGGGSVTVTNRQPMTFGLLYHLELNLNDQGSGNHRPIVRLWNEAGNVSNLHVGSTVSWTPANEGLVSNGAGAATYDSFNEAI